MKFRKLVAIEPVSLIPSAEQELHNYAHEVVLYTDIPASADDIDHHGRDDGPMPQYTLCRHVLFAVFS